MCFDQRFAASDQTLPQASPSRQSTHRPNYSLMHLHAVRAWDDNDILTAHHPQGWKLLAQILSNIIASKQQHFCSCQSNLSATCGESITPTYQKPSSMPQHIPATTICAWRSWIRDIYFVRERCAILGNLAASFLSGLLPTDSDEPSYQSIAGGRK